MTCNICGEKPKKACPKDFTKTVIEIDNPETLVLLRKVSIPASMGDETQVPASIGKYRNVILQYEANGHIYLYSSDGIPTAITSEVPQEVLDRIAALEDDTSELQQEFDDFKNSPDVVDIVATYADLQAYDTAKLGDRDIIRVLADENHDGASTYYQWDKPNSEWDYIGEVGPYYTKDQVDTLLAAKQNNLTAGSNISITQSDDDLVISATDTTYSNFTGTDGVSAGAAGLVPAPAATDAGKVLGADGTWTQGGPAVVQTTGLSTTDVMSQDASTKMVFVGGGGSTKNNICIGAGSQSRNANSIAIGYNIDSHGVSSIAIGNGGASGGTDSIVLGGGTATADGSIAIGRGAKATARGVFDVGTSGATYPSWFGYNGSNYRLLTGLYDPQSAHDAATKGYVDPSTDSSAPTTATTGRLGEIRIDTSTDTAYICVKVDSGASTYTWKQITT